MRKLLLLALLLYDVVALGTRTSNYDYDEPGTSKIHPVVDDRRSWRRKALSKLPDNEHKEWEDRRRHDYEVLRYGDDPDTKVYSVDKLQKDHDFSIYRGQKRFEDSEKVAAPRSAEIRHGASYYNGEKESTKKPASAMNCDRPHERYEACFAGCASVTCDNPRDRMRSCYPFCEPGCICLHPYVRDDRTHKCVLPDDCTKGLKGIPDLGEDI